jgi:4-hydroxy-2-oxoheptanedioate aldolase
MRKNMVKERLRRGEPCIGTWVDTGNPLAAEILAEAGYHWLAVDMEHNAIDLEDVLHCFYAMTTHDTVPFVRVPWNDPQILKRVLDIGAYGVFVPEIHGLEDAEAALRACRYAPQGARGVGGVRGRVYGGEDYHERANEEVAVVLMVEDIAMVRQLDQICRLPGLDGLFIGPQDLAASLGLSQLGYDNPDPDHRDAVNKVLEIGKRYGVSVGIHCGSIDEINRRIEEGFLWITYQSDARFLFAVARETLAQIKLPARTP